MLLNHYNHPFSLDLASLTNPPALGDIWYQMMLQIGVLESSSVVLDMCLQFGYHET